MLRLGTAVETVKSFFDAYLGRRDLEDTLAHVTDAIQWVGTGKSTLVRGRVQVRQSLKAEFAKAPDPYRIVFDQITEAPISEHSVSVQLTATVYSCNGEDGGVWLRVTMACAEENGQCRIASLHASTPDGQQAEGEFFPAAGINRSDLERRLGAKALDLLGKSIPGGMMGGYLEPEFPLYYVNDQMLSYLGYTYDEFVAAIDGKVINCMHPEDRERVDAAVDEAFAQGKTYEVQYRMLKNGGSYIWVNDVGKKGLSSDGRAVCISVIRDISEEIEVQEQLRLQAEEQQRLATQYDHLFQSVLCGIVQYRLSGSKVTFVNANREAIRIFGYTPEEFWTKKDWDILALTSSEDRDKMHSDITALMQPGSKNNYEYRLLQKNGSTCWIIGSAEVLLDEESQPLIQSVFLDINSRKKAELRSRRLAEQVEASNEILHLALEHTPTCEFYYYPQTGMCEIPERTSTIYHCQRHYDNVPQSFAKEQVYEQDHPAFHGMYERILRGERNASCRFRCLGSELWCRVTLSVVLTGDNGTPQLAVGIVEDISHQIEMENALEAARSRDPLTGLYNKESGVGLVQDYLAHGRAPEENCVMMLLDMDDFGDINEKEGTVFSDVILQEIADLFRAETDQEDIRIRLGGDEFMLFLKGRGKKPATEIGPRIASLAKNIVANTENGIQVSVSIGMCSTEVTENYNELYRCAESSLKYVKEHDKGNAACYLDVSHKLGVYLTKLYPEEHPVNTIERETAQDDQDLVSFALDLLGKSKNLNDAVQLLLARVGKVCRFDRVSIIENNRAYLSYRFSYQWARNQTYLQLNQDFYVSEQDFDDCAAMYDEEGLCEHNLRDSISRFPSCLHAGFWDHDEYAGSMSFESEEVDYHWTREQRKLLKELVKLIPSFIMKSKADAVSQAKTDFLSRMSHEIRTPMNAISGMTTIAKSVVDDRKKTLECLNKIESANEYLLRLINDILDMSRIESGKMSLNYGPMDLGRILASLESLLLPQATVKKLSLRIENGYSGKRLLNADSLRINQVLVNIIGNAIKFTEQGCVIVRVEELESDPQAVLRFSVTDTGIGIDPAAYARIFYAFEQAEASTASLHGGTGLGLSISSRLVQMMGGTLEVRSKVDVGSEFYFTLRLNYAPEQDAAVTVSTEPAEESHVRNFHDYHLLIAEDNALNREIAQTILEMNGFTVTCAVDGQDALDLYYAAEPGQYDGILMDIRMPVMDGLEATRRIRTSGRPDARTIPIIALSANAFDEDSKKSIASGMNGHLSKPIQIEQMIELLGKLLDSRERPKGGAS